jgi:intracellular sulfur oxidation DsrE/DsrF family protein
MQNVTRRSFVSTATAGLAALGAFGSLAEEANAQLVWKANDWKLADFEKLLKDSARIKQVYDVTQIGEGKFLNNVKNSLNGLRFGFNVPEHQIKIAAALHGPTNMLNYDDFIWEKYGIGAWLKVTDPATGKAATRNPFYKSTLTSKNDALNNLNDKNSIYQDTSIETLQSRGVQFLSCHTATEEQARLLIKRNNWSKDPEEIVHEMLAHTLPGVLVVASMVAAVALLQAEGHYTYITL